MKVLCINDKLKTIEPGMKSLIKENEVYEVVKIHNEFGLKYYELDIHPEAGYSDKYFIPLSDIDETSIKAKRAQNEDVYVYDMGKYNITDSRKSWVKDLIDNAK